MIEITNEILAYIIMTSVMLVSWALIFIVMGLPTKSHFIELFSKRKAVRVIVWDTIRDINIMTVLPDEKGRWKDGKKYMYYTCDDATFYNKRMPVFFYKKNVASPYKITFTDQQTMDGKEILTAEAVRNFSETDLLMRLFVDKNIIKTIGIGIIIIGVIVLLLLLNSAGIIDLSGMMDKVA